MVFRPCDPCTMHLDRLVGELPARLLLARYVALVSKGVMNLCIRLTASSHSAKSGTSCSQTSVLRPKLCRNAFSSSTYSEQALGTSCSGPEVLWHEQLRF
eukprot:gnl/TRDRNA2_/TRDRNA2_174106_c1_seq3.p1 gnl/TRDRNA2_/TRDRNA2_174106_c1~~gnl/TRDRNA2_/TRDRNA2_174106_c1_seq3.p1  ORF type:complete len:100 (+),score=1.44 gnl/TRDRNA2_/TRDRNA2_174106_c1_seq3:17-316(+)